MKHKYYTGVGSRETPVDVLDIMRFLALVLAKKGWILRSGAAPGADTAFELGARDLASVYDPEIYIPWYNFVKSPHEPTDYLMPKHWPNYEQAMQIASETHPAWDKCSDGAKALHSRNIYQVLGKDLNTPSSFLVAYGVPTKTGVKGGTNTAWQLGKKYCKQCFNLYVDEDRERILKFIRSHCEV